MHSGQAVVKLASTANYLALNLLFSSRYLAPGEPIGRLDTREFSPGHWGCVPGLNFIWANLVSYGDSSGIGFVPILGTGHGGAAWAAWSVLQRAGRNDGLKRPELDALFQSFGDDDLWPHEMFGRVDDLTWPSGELGYALGVAQGASSQVRDRVVAIIGDGELETGCTLSALAAASSVGRPPLVIVNANGYRMGSQSWFSRLPHHGRDFIESLGWTHYVVREGDADGFQVTLTTHEPLAVVVYLNSKGGHVPPLTGQEPRGEPVHKLPIKRVTNNTERVWLRQWLDSFSTEALSDAGLDYGLNRRVAVTTRTLPTTFRLEPSSAPTSARSDEESANLLASFLNRVADHAADALVFSPDEASSNMVDRYGFEVREFLSEQLTLAWAIGAASVGRPSLWASYEAFAPLVTTMITQYARHLAAADPSGRPRTLPCVLVTSLSFRNVPSHQDVAFWGDVERRRLPGVAMLVPHLSDVAAEAADLAHSDMTTANRIPIVVLDKHGSAPRDAVADCEVERPASGWIVYRFGTARADSRHVAIAAFGAAEFGEAIRAARFLVDELPRLVCDVFVQWLVVPGGPRPHTHTDLFSRYAAVAAVAGMPSAAWDEALHPSRIDGRLVHDATFSPTNGPNPVARLMTRDLDWLAIARSLAMAQGHASLADKCSQVRRANQRIAERSRLTDWYNP